MKRAHSIFSSKIYSTSDLAGKSLVAALLMASYRQPIGCGAASQQEQTDETKRGENRVTLLSLLPYVPSSIMKFGKLL